MRVGGAWRPGGLNTTVAQSCVSGSAAGAVRPWMPPTSQYCVGLTRTGGGRPREDSGARPRVGLRVWREHFVRRADGPAVCAFVADAACGRRLPCNATMVRPPRDGPHGPHGWIGGIGSSGRTLRSRAGATAPARLAAMGIRSRAEGSAACARASPRAFGSVRVRAKGKP